jgi:hypothetical protein
MAGYFDHCGLDLGKNLIGPRSGNQRGHFEDRDFVEFHDQIFSANKCNKFTPKRDLRISAVERKKACLMMKERAEMGSNWGWKDPRTSLFLDFWTALEPNIKFVFLYRDPILVMDSLFRRGDKRFFISPWLTAKLWIRYNREVLRYHKIHGNRSFLVNIKGFNENYGDAAQLLGNRLGFQLSKPYTDVFRSDEISMTPALSTKLKMSLLLIYFRKSLTDLFLKLESRAIINSLGVNPLVA